MRLGIDWGGTKIEAAVLDASGAIVFRNRITTPKGNYGACLEAVASLINRAELETGSQCSVGIGIPGSVSPTTGLIKNANSVWLNNKSLLEDIQHKLGRDVRMQNDANCLAVSEAVDGAGEGCGVVLAIVIGTGCGCGIAIDGKPLTGRHAIAGEFGHTPLPWPHPDEFPGETCWCGKKGCLETWISGTGFERDYQRRTGISEPLCAEEIIALETPLAIETMQAYQTRLARGLGVLVNIIDPDIVVLGGGMSNVKAVYKNLAEQIQPYIFSDTFNTPIVPAMHGDSSGVRGAAWLW